MENNNLPTLEEFKKTILSNAEEIRKECPEWRLGQTVFNLIDSAYGVAREIQFKQGIDCFYDDSKIDEFIDAVYKLIKD